MKALRSVYRLLDALESGEDSLETGKPLQRSQKRHIALLELMEEALESEDAGDLLELLEFVRKYGAKMRRDLKREMLSDSYYPSPSGPMLPFLKPGRDKHEVD